MQVEIVPSGSLALDIALGTGGLPRGRIIEVYGPESSGKTTVALHAIAEVQKAGGQVAFIDAEHALDPSYASKLGVNIDELCSPNRTRVSRRWKLRKLWYAVVQLISSLLTRLRTGTKS